MAFTLNSCKHEPDLRIPLQPKDSIYLEYIPDSILISQGTTSKSSEPFVYGKLPINFNINTTPYAGSSVVIDSLGIIHIDSSLAVGEYKASVTASNVNGSFAFKIGRAHV